MRGAGWDTKRAYERAFALGSDSADHLARVVKNGSGWDFSRTMRSIFLSWPLIPYDSIDIGVGDYTYVLNTVATFYDGTQYSSVLANVPRFHATRGYHSSPATTNKCENYNVIPADEYQPALIATETMGWGKIYEIVSQATLDFGTIGTLKSGTANTAGATYLITSTVATLGVGDSAKEIKWAVGTISGHNGVAFVNNFDNMTLSRDVAAVLSIVDDAAALAAYGKLDSTLNPADKVYMIDASGCAGISNCRITGKTGNTNPHSLGLIGRVLSGATNVYISGQFGDRVDITSGVYARVVSTTSVPNATDEGVLQVFAGGVTLFTVNQLEESSFSTNPVLTAGASATNNKSELSIQTSGNLPDSGVRHMPDNWTCLGVGTVKQCIKSSWSDANNYWALWQDASGTTITFEKMVGGVSEVATVTTTAPLAAGTTYALKPVFNADNTMNLWVDGVADTVNTSTTAAVVSGATIRFGDLNGTFTMYGNLRNEVIDNVG